MSVSSLSFNKRTYKIILLGDSNTGKTSIIERFVHNRFDQKDNPTIGIDFLGKNVQLNNSVCRLQLWDTAGQQRFRSLIPSYIKDAVCVIFVFDLSKPQTLCSLQYWINLFRQNKGEKTIMAFCGNKSDLTSSFKLEKLKQISQKYKASYFQCSAKSGQGVEHMFIQIISQTQLSQIKKKKKYDQAELIAPLTHQNFKQKSILSIKIQQSQSKQKSKINRLCCF